MSEGKGPKPIELRRAIQLPVRLITVRGSKSVSPELWSYTVRWVCVTSAKYCRQGLKPFSQHVILYP